MALHHGEADGNLSPPMRAHDPYALAPRLPVPASGAPLQVESLLTSARSERIEIEIGPGRGGFLFERLEARSDVGMLGFEIRRKWAKTVDDRLARLGYGARARVFAEDAKAALPVLTPDASIAAFFINFPDPWWKKRHQKRLVVGSPVLNEIGRLLRPSGELFVQTDVEERAEAYEALAEAHGSFATGGDSEGSARLAANPYGATSHRERRAVADAIPIYRLRFIKR
jgi:tRNA (guanine-N7-)-methyltransferase